MLIVHKFCDIMQRNNTEARPFNLIGNLSK